MPWMTGAMTLDNRGVRHITSCRIASHVTVSLSLILYDLQKLSVHSAVRVALVLAFPLRPRPHALVYTRAVVSAGAR
jgi:hypothetical protein